MKDADEMRQISIDNGLPYDTCYLKELVISDIEKGVEAAAQKGKFIYDSNLRRIMLFAENKNNGMPCAIDQYNRLTENKYDYQEFLECISDYFHKYHYYVEFKMYNEPDYGVKFSNDDDYSDVVIISGRRGNISDIRVRWDDTFESMDSDSIIEHFATFLGNPVKGEMKFIRKDDSHDEE